LPPVREPRLLVVANPYESAMIRRAAEYAGVLVREADDDTVEGVVREFQPDVVVVAAALAHGEGVSVIGRLQAARGSSSHPRLIAVGGEGTPLRSADDARRLGAEEFLPRPVDLEGLVARIMRAAGRRVTASMPLVDLRSVVAARVEADLSGALDAALGAVSEPRATQRNTLPLPMVAPPPPPPPGGLDVRSTLRLPTMAPAAPPPAAPPAAPPPAAPAPPPAAAPTAPAPRDTVQMSVVVVPEAEAVLPAAPPAAPPPTAPPRVLTESEAAVLRARVEALLPLVREGDYFAVLGVPRDATAADVERAWHEARADLEPAVAEPALGDGLRDALAAVRRVLDEAHRVLRDDQVRSEYRAHL
jgi:ActR/RegA family two-component response regulator